MDVNRKNDGNKKVTEFFKRQRKIPLPHPENSVITTARLKEHLMKLRLYHGRNTPEQEMDDWGFEGATLFGVDGIIWTYGVPRVFFINDEYFNIAREVTGWDEIADGLEMRVYEDLIKTKDGYFGDWELIKLG
ncbi:Uncharacterised protein [Legionella pneumophila]|nr:Uncharacterised protein [Legionella pneumophila]CZI36451.1 Uncharacterised protein [Legionella pneumophila]CZI43921.1 Uncharacterised protein [Legionella pneumophila]CZI57919.1 Uncharacterised protein [Legionella pneumophila]CZI67182.1 Uncharacterised protein [Legionella pneumophila]